MCLVFFTQYLDKQSLAYASVYGLITDLDLTDTQYSWLTSGFYLAQLVSEGKVPCMISSKTIRLLYPLFCRALHLPHESITDCEIRWQHDRHLGHHLHVVWLLHTTLLGLLL